MALPGKIDNPLSAGPHKLIREAQVGRTQRRRDPRALQPLSHAAAAAEAAPPSLPSEEAEIVAGPVDEAAVKAKSHPNAEPPRAASISISLTEPQRELMDALGTDSANVDTLVERRTNLPARRSSRN